MRRAARRDENHAEIVAGLRKSGCDVVDLGAVGNGCPDLLVRRCGRLILIEVKDGAKPPSERRLTPDQVKFHALWGDSVVVVTSLTEALSAIGAVS
ncbi:hypothetical protein [Stenotrophomonas sp. AB1(2024)]|uniref:hypothetical protein n=1 Tax=Stenotrophomonas sp. AB1(2024) TaxID=3132215 RepID=UPI0030987B1A